jgi:aspartyl-tRNA synthetase
LRIKDLTTTVVDSNITSLRGWVDNVRDHGGLTFIDLRDFESTIQLVFDKESSIEVNVKSEYYIEISGIFKKRDSELINKKTLLGEFEITVNEITVVNPSKSLPFQIEDGIETDETIRLKYRYLDLRRNEMKHNIVARSKLSRVLEIS